MNAKHLKHLAKPETIKQRWKDKFFPVLLSRLEESASRGKLKSTCYIPEEYSDCVSKFVNLGFTITRFEENQYLISWENA